MARFAPPGPPFVGNRGPNGLFNPFGSKRVSAGGAPVSYATWNPADKGSTLTLSNGDLTVSSAVDSDFNMVRATIGKASGKWYWEYTVTNKGSSAQTLMFGVADATTANISGTIVFGNNPKQYGMQLDAGSVRVNGGPTNDWAGSTPDTVNGDVWGLAFDMDNGRLYVHKSGTYLNSGDPAAGTGFVGHDFTGTYYPAFGVFPALCVLTANFGATAFAHSVPTGYTSGVTA